MLTSFTCHGTLQAGPGDIMRGSWPWARLLASATHLTISAPIYGELAFRPEEVVALEKRGWLPVLDWGIRIRHIKTDAPRVVGFMTWRWPGAILRGIARSGFLPRGIEHDSCLECEGVLPAGSSRCPKCGWSYESGKDEA